jgi:hypothetical protein
MMVELYEYSQSATTRGLTFSFQLGYNKKFRIKSRYIRAGHDQRIAIFTFSYLIYSSVCAIIL